MDNSKEPVVLHIPAETISGRGVDLQACLEADVVINCHGQVVKDRLGLGALAQNGGPDA